MLGIFHTTLIVKLYLYMNLIFQKKILHPQKKNQPVLAVGPSTSLCPDYEYPSTSGLTVTPTSCLRMTIRKLT